MNDLVKDFFTITRIYGAYYEIYSPATGVKLAVPRGKFRTRKQTERHPFVVGDYVTAEKGENEEYAINELLDRRNFLIRQSSPGDRHVLCANVDQVAILVSLKNPEFKYSFIDRCLAAVSVSGISPLIVFTKKDLMDEDEIREKTEIYSRLGYSVSVISIHEDESINRIKKLFDGKVTYLVGNSGVGKSTLLNLVIGSNMQHTNEVSDSSLKGKHTTTNANAIVIDANTMLIDSPGIKEWGVLHLDKEDIINSFPELNHVREKCTYKFCCDFSRECALNRLIEADDSAEMDEERKRSYLMMVESLDRPKRFTRKDWIKKGKLEEP